MTNMIINFGSIDIEESRDFRPEVIVPPLGSVQTLGPSGDTKEVDNNPIGFIWPPK